MEFIEAVWPWFLEVAHASTYDRRQVETHFDSEPAWILDFDDDDDRLANTILTYAMDIALRDCANADPDNFLDFLGQYSHADCLLVQRLFRVR